MLREEREEDGHTTLLKYFQLFETVYNTSPILKGEIIDMLEIDRTLNFKTSTIDSISDLKTLDVGDLKKVIDVSDLKKEAENITPLDNIILSTPVLSLSKIVNIKTSVPMKLKSKLPKVGKETSNGDNNIDVIDKKNI